MNSEAWLDQVRWTNDGLVPAVAQDASSGRLMMMAWMNRQALAATVAEGRAIYWSRSRQRLWRKGEQSGHEQKVKEIRLDCDHAAAFKPTLLLQTTQLAPYSSISTPTLWHLTLSGSMASSSCSKLEDGVAP